jgi:hypothetical protein
MSNMLQKIINKNIHFFQIITYSFLILYFRSSPVKDRFATNTNKILKLFL